MTSKIAFMLLLFSTHFLYAQQVDCFWGIPADPIKKEAMIQQVKQKAGNDINQLAQRHKKELSEIYTSRATTLIEKLERGDFYFNEQVTNFFQKIFEDILLANPNLANQEVRLLVSRYGYPNAYCMGEGTLVFNLELLPWLENESQIAFILCHELAHHQLNHVNIAIQEKVAWYTSKETEKELKKIANSEFGVYDKAQSFLQQNTFEDRRHSRLHEAEADALAIELMKKTHFDVQEAINCLAILDKVSPTRLKTELDLSTIFNAPAYPFKTHWLTQEESIFSGIIHQKEAHSDSLKTHPDCQKRIALLQPILASIKPNASTSASTSLDQLQALIYQSDFELIQNNYFFQNLGRSLFNSLLLLKKHPTEACLHAMIGRNLYELHQAQTNKETRNYLAPINQFQNPEYKKLLTFLENLRLKELARINYHYLKNKATQFIDHQGFHHALLLATELMNKPEEYQRLKDAYQEKYDNNKNY